ncbi:hypothetical protein QO259_09990 [Salinicola sp. JS01]|uniref:hypothetical protein n=1 Tax=Salinicola sp. JS01 TaxID=3050071 RepID=UPI00255BC206|nr:hypothetical protein [Salinicola sp. JS01]WIX34942.1 hypothetical protein QO259_09990 [Salinicola sp. JS01]
MSSRQREILTAIRTECQARRGPCPPGLVAVALDVATTSGRERLERQLVELTERGWLEAVEDTFRGNGWVVTPAGRQVLDTRPDATPPADSPKPPPSPMPAPMQTSPACRDAELLRDSYALALDCAAALIDGQRDPHASQGLEQSLERLVLYRRIAAHCKALHLRQQQREAEA